MPIDHFVGPVLHERPRHVWARGIPLRGAVAGLAALVASVAGLATVATAGNISINMTTTAEIRDGNLGVALKVSNTGDEAAGSVRASLRFRDQQTNGPVRDSLVPQGELEEQLSVPVPGLGTGRWPFRVAVDYTDANQYPFQALHVAVVASGDPPPAKVVVARVEVPALSASTQAEVVVKNLTGEAREATVSVFVPDGLETSEPTRQVSLAPWGEQETSLPLVNRTALAGSRYPVFVAVEYEDGGVHQAAIAHGIVEIQPPRRLAARGLLWLVAALVVGWVVLLGWRVLRRRAA